MREERAPFASVGLGVSRAADKFALAIGLADEAGGAESGKGFAFRLRQPNEAVRWGVETGLLRRTIPLGTKGSLNAGEHRAGGIHSVS